MGKVKLRIIFFTDMTYDTCLRIPHLHKLTSRSDVTFAALHCLNFRRKTIQGVEATSVDEIAVGRKNLQGYIRNRVAVIVI